MTYYSRYLTSFSNDSAHGSVTWSNPSNAATSNNSRAGAIIASSSSSQYLKGLNLTEDVPGASGTAIASIDVYVEGYETFGGTVTIDNVKLVKAGTIQSVNKGGSTLMPTSESEVSFSFSGSDITGWTIADVNSDTFGVVVSVDGQSGMFPAPFVDDVFIDCIRVRIGIVEGAIAGTFSGSGSVTGTGTAIIPEGQIAGTYSGSGSASGTVEGLGELAGSFTGTGSLSLNTVHPRYYTGDFASASGSSGWVDKSYALADDDNFAYITNANSLNANKLLLTSWNTELPASAQIKGFAVMLKGMYPGEVAYPEGGEPAGLESNFDVYLTLDGTNAYGAEPLQFKGTSGGIAYPPGYDYPEEWKGSASWVFMTDVITPEDVNASTFGLYIQANGPNEWLRTHVGLEPEYDVINPTDDGTYNYGSGYFKVGYAKLYIFVEFKQQLAGEGDSEGNVTLSWEVS